MATLLVDSEGRQKNVKIVLSEAHYHGFLGNSFLLKTSRVCVTDEVDSRRNETGEGNTKRMARERHQSIVILI